MKQFSVRAAAARWKHIDDGRLWFGVYNVRTIMLLLLAASSAAFDAWPVSIAVMAVVVPYNVAAMMFHRRAGRAHALLPLDQPLAALMVVLSIQALNGAVICILVAAVTSTVGLPVRRVQTFSAMAAAILAGAALTHHDVFLVAVIFPLLGSACSVSNVISYMKNKRSASSERFENLLDGMHAYVHEADLESGEIVYCNRQITELIGVVKCIDDVVKFIHPEDLPNIARGFAKGLKTLTPITSELRLVVGDSTYYMEQRTTFVKYRGRVRERSVLFDVSARKRIELEMAHRAFHDSLTELPNRALFLDRLEHALVRGTESGSQHAVLLLDLDNFKDVNDGMGHQVGDATLVEIASRLNRRTSRTNTLARLGGDEFAVLLEDTTAEGALEVGRQLIDIVGMAYCNGEMTYFPRVSIGVASFPKHGTTSSELLGRADVAMYQAKRLRLGVIGFEEDMNPASAEKLAVLADFRSALTNNELEAFFQPVVNSATGKITSCEALVRWNHPTHGLLAPSAFVPTICAGGLSSDLAYWMLGQVVEQIDDWNQLGVAVPIAVNLSAVDVSDAALIDWLLRELDRRTIPPSLLTIELTESELLDQSAKTIDTLKRLREAGVTTAVDDFGTGYSSLVWLRDLPIRTLKIDRSFIESLFSDERSETIVRSTIQMAQALHLDIIGEGVENSATAAMLRELGCHNLQGYLFSKPVHAVAMKQILLGGDYAIDGLLSREPKATLSANGGTK
jgi:diguanylate cyclase (GGDEF)-like protein